MLLHCRRGSEKGFSSISSLFQTLNEIRDVCIGLDMQPEPVPRISAELTYLLV